MVALSLFVTKDQACLYKEGNWCVNHSLQLNQFDGRQVEEEKEKDGEV